MAEKPGSPQAAAALLVMIPLAVLPAGSGAGAQIADGNVCRPTDPLLIPSTSEAKPMTDKRATTYDTYLSAWSAIPDSERRRLLRESVSEDIVFTNPLQARAGIDGMVAHLEAFQHRSPNGKFVSLAILGWDNHALATWQFVDADGTRGFTGYDVVSFDDQGRIATILLFSNVDKQRLK
jgi:hypothetical protein